MKNLTHFKAVELSLPIWKYLAKTGKTNIEKIIWIHKNQQNEILKYGTPTADCWLCQMYYLSGGINQCGECPIQINLGCCNKLHSNWNKWCDAGIENNNSAAKYHARIIYNVLEKELQRLNRENPVFLNPYPIPENYSEFKNDDGMTFKEIIELYRQSELQHYSIEEVLRELYSYEDGTILKAIYRKANKDHVCNVCGQTIPKNNKYLYSSIKFDEILTYKTCFDCVEAYQSEWLDDVDNDILTKRYELNQTR